MSHDDDTCPHLVVLGRMEAEIARLKAEVERLTTIIGADAIDREHGMCCDASAQVERLTKAGDDLYAEVGIHSRHHNCGSRDEWLRAKKGLPSLKEQYEKQKVLGWDFVRPPMPNAAKEGKPQP
jgi:hypothetical protein